MLLTKLPQHRRKVPQAIPLMRRLLRLSRTSRSTLPHQRQLEPKPVLGRLCNARDVPPLNLDAADKLVKGVLVRVGRVGEVADALVVLGEETIAEELGEAAVRGGEVRFEVGEEGLLEG